MTKQKKDGFTLIELLGVLVLLTIISLISFKVIDSSLKKGKTDAYEKQLKMIELAAKNWASDNLLDLPTLGNQATISLMRLKMDGYIDTDVSDPISGKCFPNDILVIIKNDFNLNLSNNYSYSVDRTTIDSSKFGTGCNVYIDEGDTDIEPQITFFVSPQQIGINEISTVTITTNLPNLDTGYIDIVDSNNFPFTAAELTALGTETYNSAKKTYSRKVKITNAIGVSGTIKLRVKEGAIKTEKYSSKEVYSPQITLISHSNVIDSDHIYERINCGGKDFYSLSSEDIIKGVKCRILVGAKPNPYTSGDFIYQDFYVLSTTAFTGSEVTMITDKSLIEFSGDRYFDDNGDSFSMNEELSQSLNDIVSKWNLLIPFSYRAKYYDYTKYNQSTFTCAEEVYGPYEYEDNISNVKARLPYLSDFNTVTACANSGFPSTTNCTIPDWLAEKDISFAVWGRYIEGSNDSYGSNSCIRNSQITALYGIGKNGITHSTIPLQIRPIIQVSIDSISSMCKLADDVCCCPTGTVCECLYKN